MTSWKWFLFLALFCILTQSFFAMMEMASVSFNKVRLQYYLGKNDRRALCLKYLLNRPALLFGTTLVVVNASLLIGSECARRFYEAVGASPFWAPITQAFLVIVIAEIAPMFAGRRYAEHAVMLGVFILYFIALALSPFIWMIDQLCRWIHHFFDSSISHDLYLNREELQHVIEDREDQFLTEEKSDLSTVVSSIFSLKNRLAKELMIPLEKARALPAGSTVADVRKSLEEEYTPYIPLFHKSRNHIIGIVYPRDLLRLAESKRIRDHARSPWFVTESVSILQILKQFRRNNQSVAVVLSPTGSAIGLLTLDELVDEIFGQDDHWVSLGESSAFLPVALDRSFPGDMTLEEFKNQYQIELHFKQAKTLAQVMELALGHVPREAESVRVDQFELTVEETTLLGIKTISVKTLS